MKMLLLWLRWWVVKKSIHIYFVLYYALNIYIASCKLGGYIASCKLGGSDVTLNFELVECPNPPRNNLIYHWLEFPGHRVSLTGHRVSLAGHIFPSKHVSLHVIIFWWNVN